jgi:hypothetical protein
MKKIGVMQPYIFPYIGYFQLISAVDIFVLYNDVNFIKKGWINRNNILLNGERHLFTIPCKDPSQNRLISETELAFDSKARQKLLNTFSNAYKKAPHYNTVMPLIEEVIVSDFGFIHEMAQHSIRKVCDFLSLETVLKSSVDYNNQELKREYRLIDICKKENIANYINAEGGQEIYTKDFFAEHGIALSFIKAKPITYKQFGSEFVPWLSIIDVMMFNTKEEIHQLLQEFELK